MRKIGVSRMPSECYLTPSLLLQKNPTYVTQRLSLYADYQRHKQSEAATIMIHGQIKYTRAISGFSSISMVLWS